MPMIHMFMSENILFGQIQLEGSNDCWDAMGWGVGRNAEVYHCHRLGGSQLFRLNVKGQLASGERCLIAQNGKVTISVCPTQPEGHWEFVEVGFA